MSQKLLDTAAAFRDALQSRCQLLKEEDEAEARLREVQEALGAVDDRLTKLRLALLREAAGDDVQLLNRHFYGNEEHHP